MTNTALIPADSSDSLGGLELVAKNDCRVCHSINNPLVGPTFTSISNKYELTAGNLSRLSKKIMSGGKGVWGDIPMVPHPQLSDDNANLMVKYILLLKK